MDLFTYWLLTNFSKNVRGFIITTISTSAILLHSTTRSRALFSDVWTSLNKLLTPTFGNAKILRASAPAFKVHKKCITYLLWISYNNLKYSQQIYVPPLKIRGATCISDAFFYIIFSCPQTAQSLISDHWSLSRFCFWHPKRFVTFETFDQSDDDTWSDQYFDNFDNLWNILEVFIFLQFWQLWIFDNFDNSENNPGDLWHLRIWLQFWQLRTWIFDNICYLTIKSDSGNSCNVSFYIISGSSFFNSLSCYCQSPTFPQSYDTSSTLVRQIFHNISKIVSKVFSTTERCS